MKQSAMFKLLFNFPNPAAAVRGVRVGPFVLPNWKMYIFALAYFHLLISPLRLDNIISSD
jgi:hypothetical protein